MSKYEEIDNNLYNLNEDNQDNIDSSYLTLDQKEVVNEFAYDFINDLREYIEVKSLPFLENMDYTELFDFIDSITSN